MNRKEKKCRYFNRGYCKYKKQCRYSHPKNVCEEYLKSRECGNAKCGDRHPRVCKWNDRSVGCNRKSECNYLHVTLANDDVSDHLSYKCISCQYTWEDRSCVVEHVINNTRTFFCLNCDDWVVKKEEVLNQGWTLFDGNGFLRRNI